MTEKELRALMGDGNVDRMSEEDKELWLGAKVVGSWREDDPPFDLARELGVVGEDGKFLPGVSRTFPPSDESDFDETDLEDV